jgi:hypothetical protein
MYFARVWRQKGPIMKRAKSITIAQTVPERNFHLIQIFLWASLFSISASISLIAAAIYIH